MNALLPEGAKVVVKLWDCGDSCGDGHPATVIEVDPDDPTLPYQVRYDEDGHETWAEYDEVKPA